MHMGRIEVAAEAASKRPDALKLVAGLLFLTMCTLLMAPWVVLITLWIGMAAGAKLVKEAFACARSILIHAGEVVVGR